MVLFMTDCKSVGFEIDMHLSKYDFPSSTDKSIVLLRPAFIDILLIYRTYRSESKSILCSEQ